MVDLQIVTNNEVFPINSALVSPKRARIWQKQMKTNKMFKPVLRNPKNLGRTFVIHNFAGMKSITERKIVLSRSTIKVLGLETGNVVSASIESMQAVKESYKLIKQRIKLKTPLDKDNVDTVVQEIISGKLSSLEQTALVFDALYHPWSTRETELFTRSFADHSDRLDLPDQAWDKHSLGGVPGNKVSLLIVPIIAASGLMIPKTSSRAITSPSGTADTMEQMGCDISFTTDEITEIISNVGGMIVWAGGLNLVPADSIIIENVERPLGIDPNSLIQVSILSKKLAMGIDGMVLDIPVGKGTKVHTMDDGISFANSIKRLSQNLGIKLESALTFGEQIIGQSTGPAIEAQEGLRALMDPKSVSASFRDKAIELSGMLFEIAGKAPRGQGNEMAKEILFSGKAYKKMIEIIDAQGGDVKKPDDIEIGSYVYEYIAPQSGYIVDIDNTALVKIAKAAGCPNDPKAGIYMLKKRDHVRMGEPILKIYASKESRLSAAITQINRLNPLTFGGMILHRI